MAIVRALLIGINSSGDSALGGCINDVMATGEMLRNRYGTRLRMKIINDRDHPEETTFNGILHNLYQLAINSYSEKPDLIYVHYSGHGTNMIDVSGDEKDRMDEAIVPSDYNSTGMVITDDLIHRILYTMATGTRVVCVFDACNSGTMCDLKYTWKDSACIVENNKSQVGAKVVVLSGCADPQTSADASFSGKMYGALTKTMLDVLRENPQARAVPMLAEIRKRLAGRFTQLPQLTSSYELSREDSFL